MSVQWYHAVVVAEGTPDAIETVICGVWVHYPSMVEIDAPEPYEYQKDIIMDVDGVSVTIMSITDTEF